MKNEKTFINPIHLQFGTMQVIRLDQLFQETVTPVYSQNIKYMEWFIVSTTWDGKFCVSPQGTRYQYSTWHDRLDVFAETNEFFIKLASKALFEHRVVCAHNRADVIAIFGDIIDVARIEYKVNFIHLPEHERYQWVSKGHYDARPK